MTTHSNKGIYFPSQQEAKVRRQQIEMLYQQAPVTLILAFLAATFGVAILWGVAHQTLLLLWLLLLGVLTIFRLLMVRVFLNRLPQDRLNLDKWGRAYVVGTTISGFVWGGLALFFNPEWPAAYQIVLFVLLSGIVAGGISANTSLPIAYPAFFIPLLSTVALVMLSQNGIAYKLVAVFIAVLGLQLFMTSKKYSQNLVKVLHLHYANQMLVDELSQANTDLKEEVIQREKAQLDAELSEQRFRSYFELGQVGMAITSPEQILLEVNEYLREMLGYTNDELIDRHWLDLICKDDQENFISEFNQVVSGGQNKYTGDIRFVGKKGSTIDTITSVTGIKSADGRTRYVLNLVQNITARKQAETKLRQLIRHNELVLNAAADGILGIDNDGMITFINEAAVKMLGWPIEELYSEKLHHLTHHTKKDGTAYPIDDCPIGTAFRDAKASQGSDEIFWRKDGTYFPVEFASTPIIDEGKVSGAVVVFRDITERIEAERALREANEKLAELATIDGLTGIANRRTFDEQLQAEWKRMAREQQSLSLILLDIDYFKNYNDHYGHQAGDDCLRLVAVSLIECIKRTPDRLARYGGEEFALILPQTSQEGAYHMAECLRKAILDRHIPHAKSEVSTQVTISLGVVSMVPQAQDQVENLIQGADKALYRAKAEGRNRTESSY
ncbi:MAG: diguanylate cyclase [Candidatus Thiodiazotropha sp.]